MAVTSIWPISGNPDGVIEYAVNPIKTSAHSREAIAALHAIDHIAEYTADHLQTEKRMYVSGVNCQIPFAKAQFKETKRRFDQLDGRTCYHGYQSFRSGEVDADTAHRVGIELAKELWGERFEVVVATHLNTDHYHNHFVINSVSFVDGKKFSNRKPDYARMREVSDRLCREHRLSVVQNPQARGKHYAEWSAEQNGKPTYRGMVKADIDRAILSSTTIQDFYRVMEQMGYTFKRYKKNGQPLEHPVAIPPGGRGVRMDGLGHEYTFDGIVERILRNTKKQIPFPEAEHSQAGKFHYRGNFKKARKVAGLRARYFYYCYRLKIIVKRPAAVKKIPTSIREDILKLDQRIAETFFLGKYRIETASDLAERRAYADAQVCVLTEQRKDLRNALRRSERLDDEEMLAVIKRKISALTDEIKRFRKEVKLCESIAAHSRLVADGLDAMSQQDHSTRKENSENEYRRRRSGTDRQNVFGWR